MKQISFIRAFFTIIFSAVLCATVLLFFSPGNEYIDTVKFADNLPQNAIEPERNGEKKRVGLIAGHYGYDSGFQCGGEYNFVKEADVTLRIAVMVQDYLVNRGYDVDLLHELDPALSNYSGKALVSIHANNCEPGGINHSGFNVSLSGRNTNPASGSQLSECLINRYTIETGLSFLGENYDIGNEMLYSFNTVSSQTPVSVIHTGYLANDYRLISEKMDLIAKGIGDGIICYTENEEINPYTPVKQAETGNSSLNIRYLAPFSASMAGY